MVMLEDGSTPQMELYSQHNQTINKKHSNTIFKHRFIVSHGITLTKFYIVVKKVEGSACGI